MTVSCWKLYFTFMYGFPCFLNCNKKNDYDERIAEFSTYVSSKKIIKKKIIIAEQCTEMICKEKESCFANWLNIISYTRWKSQVIVLCGRDVMFLLSSKIQGEEWIINFVLSSFIVQSISWGFDPNQKPCNWHTIISFPF